MRRYFTRPRGKTRMTDTSQFATAQNPINNDDFIKVAIQLLKAARVSIHFSTFKLEIAGPGIPKRIRPLFEEFKAAAERGVKVLGLVNWRPGRAGVPRTNDYNAHALVAAGAQIRYLKSGRCIHAKIIVIDGRAALIGSHNLSVRSLQSNFEVSLLVENAATAAALAAIIEHYFNDAKAF